MRGTIVAVPFTVAVAGHYGTAAWGLREPGVHAVFLYVRNVLDLSNGSHRLLMPTTQQQLKCEIGSDRCKKTLEPTYFYEVSWIGAGTCSIQYTECKAKGKGTSPCYHGQ